MSFSEAMPVIFRHEGGYVDHPRDPGGATNLGITHLTLADWRGTRVSKADVKALTKAEAEKIYRARYWETVSGDRLPAGVALSVFDMAVNAGPARGARLLQRIVGVADDGQIGPKTLEAVSNFDPVKLVNAYAEARLAYYKRLPHWDAFGRGWTRRTEETRTAALAIIKRARSVAKGYGFEADYAAKIIETASGPADGFSQVKMRLGAMHGMSDMIADALDDIVGDRAADIVGDLVEDAVEDAAPTLIKRAVTWGGPALGAAIAAALAYFGLEG